MTDILLTSIDERGVARVRMNRPDVHNAFNAELIAALDRAFAELGEDARVRLVVLEGAGRSFSAGADLDWMKAAAAFTEEQNRADARALSDMLHRLDTCPKPTLALVQGAALGGGAGLVACADIAIAQRGTKFGFTEARLGLIPAAIGPYVLARIGAGAARRYFLTGERFGADAARRLDLVHEIVDGEDALAAAAEHMIVQLLACAPGAQSAAKELIAAVGNRPVDEAIREDTAARIAVRRASEEAREGMAAFLEKRKALWMPE